MFDSFFALALICAVLQFLNSLISEKRVPKKLKMIIAVVIFTFAVIGIIGDYYLDAEQNQKISNIDDIKTKIEDSENKIKKITSEGIETCDFNGGIRKTSSGNLNVTIDETYVVFRNIEEQINKKNYNEAIKISNEQIKKTPICFALYYYLGIAYYGSGEAERAIENFDNFLLKAPNTDDYKSYKEKAREYKNNVGLDILLK